MLTTALLIAQLEVTTTTPDALCPPVAAVRNAVDSRLSTIELPEPWKLSYAVAHRDGADIVRLELSSGGTVKLVREFPGAGESCDTLAQVMAVVVERYFRTFTDDASTDDASAIDSVEIAPQGKTTQPAPSQPSLSARRHSLFGGGFVAVVPVAFGPYLRYGFQLRWPGYIAVSANWQLVPQVAAMGPGQVERTSWSLAVALGPSFRLTRTLELETGFELGSKLEHASSTGLPRVASGWRAVPWVGWESLFTYAPSATWGAFVGGAIRATYPGLVSNFEVDDRSVFAPSPVWGALQTGIFVSW